MYHIVFVCQKYTNEREKINDLLVRDKKMMSIKEILKDDEEYTSAFLEYIWKINYINKI